MAGIPNPMLTIALIRAALTVSVGTAAIEATVFIITKGKAVLGIVRSIAEAEAGFRISDSGE